MTKPVLNQGGRRIDKRFVRHDSDDIGRHYVLRAQGSDLLGRLRMFDHHPQQVGRRNNAYQIVIDYDRKAADLVVGESFGGLYELGIRIDGFRRGVHRVPDLALDGRHTAGIVALNQNVAFGKDPNDPPFTNNRKMPNSAPEHELKRQREVFILGDRTHAKPHDVLHFHRSSPFPRPIPANGVPAPSGRKTAAVAKLGTHNLRRTLFGMGTIELTLPSWLLDMIDADHAFATFEDKMSFATMIADRNTTEGTGGPFGAAVFMDSTLVSAGVNLVVGSGYSMAHAEVVALTFAQQRTGGFDLSDPTHQLVTSAEPCAMCLGATVWSGVQVVVIGARGEDAEAIGFDEGPKPVDWLDELERRGIAVTRDVLREQAKQVLVRYAEAGGEIYNAGK